jgi:protein NEDD1
VLNYTGSNGFTREITEQVGDSLAICAFGQKSPVLQGGRSCITFNSASRYIVGGGTDGNIYVWDLKSNPHTLKKSYKVCDLISIVFFNAIFLLLQDHKGTVTSLQFNWNDTVIASGSETGDIILYNVVTGVGSSMSHPRTQVTFFELLSPEYSFH